MAVRGTGPLGRQLIVGFTRYDPILNQYEYVTAFSEDSGRNWSLAFSCENDRQFYRGIVATQNQKVLCISSSYWSPALRAREWLGATWGPATVLPLSGVPLELPSFTLDALSTLHLAVSVIGKTYHLALPAAAGWSQPRAVGTGERPVISTDGQRLHIYAYDPQSWKESWIRTYFSDDKVVWQEAQRLKGSTLQYVLDRNARWRFSDSPGDGLISFKDVAGEIGNRIGLQSFMHRLDSLDKKVSFSFVPESSGPVTEIKLWYSAQGAPDYRVGIQTDSGSGTGSTPSGTWVNEVRAGDLLVSGAFTVVTFPNGGGSGESPTEPKLPSISVQLPETLLQAGLRYHLVVEPVRDPLGVKVPGPTKWVALQSVSADAGSEGTLRVLDFIGGWSSISQRVPRFLVGSGQTYLAQQELTPAGILSANQWSLPGERFALPRNMSPTEVRVFLRRVGNPSSGPTIRILGSDDEEIWSELVSPTAEGWTSVPIAGLSLTSGAMYRAILDDPTRDANSYWTLGLSSADSDSSSWHGTVSSATRASDRLGFNDRSSEASDRKEWNADLSIFNSHGSDELFLGDPEPFDFAVLVRTTFDAGGLVNASYSYWNGTEWRDVTPDADDFLHTGRGGEFHLTPPADWTKTSVDGKEAYWIKVRTTAGSPQPVTVSRITTIRDLRYPTVAPVRRGFIPLAFGKFNYPPGVSLFHCESRDLTELRAETVEMRSRELEVTEEIIGQAASQPTGLGSVLYSFWRPQTLDEVTTRVDSANASLSGLLMFFSLPESGIHSYVSVLEGESTTDAVDRWKIRSIESLDRRRERFLGTPHEEELQGIKSQIENGEWRIYGAFVRGEWGRLEQLLHSGVTLEASFSEFKPPRLPRDPGSDARRRSAEKEAGCA